MQKNIVETARDAGTFTTPVAAIDRAGLEATLASTSFLLPVTSSFSTVNPAVEKLGPFHPAPACQAVGPARSVGR